MVRQSKTSVTAWYRYVLRSEEDFYWLRERTKTTRVSETIHTKETYLDYRLSLGIEVKAEAEAVVNKRA